MPSPTWPTISATTSQPQVAQVLNDVVETDQLRAAAEIEPDQVGKQDDDGDEARDPGPDGFKMRAPDSAREQEHHDKAEQDQARIGREQQQARIDAGREPEPPVASLAARQ